MLPKRSNDLIPAPNPGDIKKRILVVDDDPQIRQSLQKVLCAEGYEVVLAAYGREGIEKFEREQIDLLLLDLGLTGISGWDVFGTVSSLNPFVPIIIITGRNEQLDLAVLSGVGALIEKPLDVPKMFQTITKLLAESPEEHLKRLVGVHSNLHHVKPARPIQQTKKAFSLLERIKP